MIPFSYNMVDMGGIDLAEANHTAVPGIYEKIQEAVNACGDVILYNWKFADIEIVPSHYAILDQQGAFLINGMIQVTELDEITILGIEQPVIPLTATENGIYEASPPVSGFNPVIVNVTEGILFPSDVTSLYYIGPLTEVIFDRNGYYAVLGAVDGSRSSTTSFSVTGATVIESDDKRDIVSSWGSAVTGVLLSASAGDSITITGTDVSRQVMIVISIPFEVILSSLDLTIKKDGQISKTISNADDQYCFFIAGSTGTNGVAVNVTSDNEQKWLGEATDPIKLHKYGAFEGNSAINCNVQGTSYATNYAMFFKAEQV